MKNNLAPPLSSLLLLAVALTSGCAIPDVVIDGTRIDDEIYQAATKNGTGGAVTRADACLRIGQCLERDSHLAEAAVWYQKGMDLGSGACAQAMIRINPNAVEKELKAGREFHGVNDGDLVAGMVWYSLGAYRESRHEDKEAVDAYVAAARTYPFAEHALAGLRSHISPGLTGQQIVTRTGGSDFSAPANIPSSADSSTHERSPSDSPAGPPITRQGSNVEVPQAPSPPDNDNERQQLEQQITMAQDKIDELESDAQQHEANAQQMMSQASAYDNTRFGRSMGADFRSQAGAERVAASVSRAGEAIFRSQIADAKRRLQSLR